MEIKFDLQFIKGFDIISAIKGVDKEINLIIEECLLNKVLKDYEGNGHSNTYTFSLDEEDAKTIFHPGIMGQLTQQQEIYEFEKWSGGYKNLYKLTLRYWPQPMGYGIYKEVSKVLQSNNNMKLMHSIYNVDQFIADYFLYW